MNPLRWQLWFFFIFLNFTNGATLLAEPSREAVVLVDQLKRNPTSTEVAKRISEYFTPWTTVENPKSRKIDFSTATGLRRSSLWARMQYVDIIFSDRESRIYVLKALSKVPVTREIEKILSEIVENIALRAFRPSRYYLDSEWASPYWSYQSNDVEVMSLCLEAVEKFEIHSSKLFNAISKFGKSISDASNVELKSKIEAFQQGVTAAKYSSGSNFIFRCLNSMRRFWNRFSN